MVSACSATEQKDATDFQDPDPEIYVSLMPAIREYFLYRKQAIILNDMTAFYERYPDLTSNTDMARGINNEAHIVTSIAGVNPFDGDISIEHYERIKVFQTGTETQVLVHGNELYLWKNDENEFDHSGGEFKIVLFMRDQDGTWQIYKTDQVTIAEWKDFQP